MRATSCIFRCGCHGLSCNNKVTWSICCITWRLANNIVPWEDIRALKAKRLIALNKLPGVRPIGVGEVGDRFLGKIMAYVTGDDVRIECNNDQLCSGIRGGIEGAIHGISQLFESQCEDGGGLLLVDADIAVRSTL